MQAPTSPPRPHRHRAAARWLITAFAVAVALSGCSSGGSTSSSSDANAASAGSGASVAGADSVQSDLSTANGTVPQAASRDMPSAADPALFGAALIKTAAVTLTSDHIETVIAKVDELAARTGGDIASEDTSTNSAGVEVRTRIELKVPVADFDRSVDEIARLGDLVSKGRSSRDVTSRVVDVSSRVTSAKDSIAQLRTLFRRATKLGDVIDLERELSAREADLEALQSQQRSLAAHTAMSTIMVNVTRPDAAAARHEDQAQGGFLSGLKQGWHGLVAFVAAVSHGLGLVLPLGALALFVVALAFFLVRRLKPRREAVPGTSE